MPVYKFVLGFTKDDGSSAYMTISEADNTKTGADVKTCMTAILTSDIFNIGGSDLAAIKDAELVATTTTEIEIPA